MRIFSQKRSIFLLLGAVFCLSSSQADEFSNNFRSHLNEATLDRLSEDLGAAVGTGSFHQGKALGFPIGFEIGVHVPVVGIQSENAILSDDGSTAHATWGQLELAVPRRVNLIGRYGQMYDADLVGGGLRVGVLDPQLPGLPAFSISGIYNELDHDFFEAEIYTINAVLSIDLPYIHPYIGGGYDISSLEVKSQAFSGVSAAIPRNIEGESSEIRVETGINLSIIPFTFVNIGFGWANGEEIYHFGSGVKF